MTIGEPALLVHAYVAAGTPGEGWREPAQRLWAAFHDLGQAAPLPNLASGPTVPEALPAAGSYALLLGARIADRPGVHEAVLYRFQDVVGLAAMLYSPGHTWADLQAIGGALAAGPLGGDLTYLGTSRASLSGRGAASSIAAQLAGHSATAGPVYRKAGGLQAAALPDLAADGRPPVGRLVVLAAPESERAMYDWTWSNQNVPELRPLARYLLHAAIIRWTWWRLNADSAFRDAAERANAATDELVALMVRTASFDDHRVRTGQLLRAQAQLSRSASRSADLATVLRDVRILQRSTRVAADGMRAALADGGTEPADGTFAGRDRALAGVLAEQLAADADYLTATHDCVTDVAQAAKTLIDERLSVRGQRLVVMQTALIGAILMGLAAIQTLGYHAPLPRRSQLPLIALLAAVALALPPAVQRFTDADRRTVRLTPAGYGLLAVCGAAAGWLALSLAGYAGGRPPGRPLAELAAAAAGALVAVVASLLVTPASVRRRGP